MKQEEQILREQLITLLNGGQAHMTFDEAVKNFPMEKINDIFPNGTYSSWHLLEHIRTTQEDILEFIINPKYIEKEWPKEYWPGKKKKATEKEWDETIKKYRADVKALEKIISDPQTNLYTNIRKFLMVKDKQFYEKFSWLPIIQPIILVNFLLFGRLWILGRKNKNLCHCESIATGTRRCELVKQSFSGI